MTTAVAPRTRIASLDIIRGIVMVLMAIDHVRVFSGVPAGGPTPGVFFTRWITNFVAPAFAFLAGTGAFLYGRRVPDRAALARFLAIRGLWLVLLELTFLRWAWTFNFDYAHYVLAGVIWMLGWCMVLLAVMLVVPTRVIGIIGVLIIVSHNALDYYQGDPSTWPAAWFWQILYWGGPVKFGDGHLLAVLYSIIPWVGVMAAGFWFGEVMTWEPARRRTFCLRLGFGAIALFLVLRLIDGYGDPNHWKVAQEWNKTTPTFLRFLATNKYPASLVFLLMTLGPMFVAIPLLEHARSRVASWLATIGRVPLFFYLLHIPLIHLSAVIVSYIRTPDLTPWLFLNHPMEAGKAPDGFMWPLWLLYLDTAIVVTILYFPCRWFAHLKDTRRDVWLSFL
ncbi:MAG TPA: heparan-alpha-glucosaminide N-acetyltransferase domain-containing protein [Gemmatimonadaceae bacterium]|nr:heparan-alpha-glucosaminide N-acetyltransferase domain-containing protein [Gemmatimonadaceae bacterium]